MPEEPEMLDRSSLSFAETERSLLELDRVNRFLLGALPLLSAILPHLPPQSYWPRLALDLGTGTGRVAHALARAADRQGSPLRIVGVDRKLKHLVIGRSLGVPQLRVVADARALPFKDSAFSWSFSTLFFHHFDEKANLEILTEMRRVAADGVAVVDLRRSRLAAFLLRLILPLLGAGPVTRHDGKVSMERAWSLEEVNLLTLRMPVIELRPRFPFRFALVLGAAAKRRV